MCARITGFPVSYLRQTYVSTAMYFCSSFTYISLLDCVGQWLDIQATILGLLTKVDQEGPITSSSVRPAFRSFMYRFIASLCSDIKLGRNGLQSPHNIIFIVSYQKKLTLDMCINNKYWKELYWPF